MSKQDRIKGPVTQISNARYPGVYVTVPQDDLLLGTGHILGLLKARYDEKQAQLAAQAEQAEQARAARI